jgi:hypothetical protein
MEMIIAKKQKEKSNPTYKINGVSIFLEITIDEYRFIFIGIPGLINDCSSIFLCWLLTTTIQREQIFVPKRTFMYLL